jgi:hypothetical protein
MLELIVALRPESTSIAGLNHMFDVHGRAPSPALKASEFFGLIELKIKPEPGATAVAVIPVRVALVPVVVLMFPIIVWAIVPIVLARGITMMARPETILLFVPRSGFSLDRKNRQ